MAVHVIPVVPSIANYSFETYIEDVQYTFGVRWNERDGFWYLDVTDADGYPIVRGERIVLNAYIGRKSTHPLFRNGVLAAIETSGSMLDATFDDLGIRVELRYYPMRDFVTEVYAL